MLHDMVVEDLLDRYPGAARVFVRRRMHCVGCPIARFETLADVCAVYRQPLEAVLAEIQEVTGLDPRAHTIRPLSSDGSSR